MSHEGDKVHGGKIQGFEYACSVIHTTKNKAKARTGVRQESPAHNGKAPFGDLISRQIEPRLTRLWQSLAGLPDSESQHFFLRRGERLFTATS